MAGKTKFHYWTVKAEKSDDKDTVSFTTRTLPKPAVRAKLKQLGIEWDVRADALPAALAEFPALEYLAVPGALVHTLTASMVPPSLRTLNIVSDESTKYALADALALPQVTSLIGFPKLVFRAAQLPNLTKLEVKLATPKMAAELATLPLRELGIGPLADKTTLAPFAKLPLTSLSILGGNVTSLAGVEAFTRLEVFHAKRLTKLTDLGALAKLGQLRDVAIEWCPKLAKVDALGKLTKLEVLDLWASKIPPKAWYALEKTLLKRKVKFDLPENIDEDEDEDE